MWEQHAVLDGRLFLACLFCDFTQADDVSGYLEGSGCGSCEVCQGFGSQVICFQLGLDVSIQPLRSHELPMSHLQDVGGHQRPVLHFDVCHALVDQGIVLVLPLVNLCPTLQCGGTDVACTADVIDRFAGHIHMERFGQHLGISDVQFERLALIRSAVWRESLHGEDCRFVSVRDQE